MWNISLLEILLYMSALVAITTYLPKFYKNFRKLILTWPISSIFHNHLVTYPTPININYFWSFGSLAGVCLGIQILTGVFLAMHYTPNIINAFNSVEHIMRDVNGGWLIRYLHANGASLFFAVVYIHIARGLYFRSYGTPRETLWWSGVIIFVLMMATAFMGYVLPWGQMSFWGATVITNLFSAIPVYGDTITKWLWGGYSVDNATLNRFFSLHYLLPFLIAGMVILHLALLHIVGSSNPLGVDSRLDQVSFYPYFYVKDLASFLVLMSAWIFLVSFYPNLLNHPDNYIEANALVTPSHIVPEWYFLPFYAILRSIPSKFWGVVYMGGAIIILFYLPLRSKTLVLSTRFRPFFKTFYWIWIAIVLLLGWLGGQSITPTNVGLSTLCTSFYFIIPMILFPLLDKLEWKY